MNNYTISTHPTAARAKPLRAEPKATLYALNCYGQLFRTEGRLDGHGRYEHWARHADNVPWVSFIDKGKRKPWRIERDTFSSYILVLAGHGHPVPPKAIGHMPWHDPDHLRDFDRDISRYISERGVDVLVDYRDVRDMESAIREYERQQEERIALMEEECDKLLASRMRVATATEPTA